jgi:hypothetical protein
MMSVFDALAALLVQSVTTLIGLAGAQAVSLRMGGNALIGWTWTISILIFPRNTILFKAFYVYVYVYVCMYVSLWFSEP